MNGPWLPLLLLAFSIYALRGACAPGFGAPRGVVRPISSLPDRPVGVGPDSFHGSQFRSFDDTAFAAGSPAVEAAPAFLFSRTGSSDDPCYPESAVVIGSDPPKMGTDGPRGPASINPGADCTNPGRYKGEMSPGNAFPVYVSAAWCDGDEVWKVNYDLYYVSVEAFPFLSEQGC
ncbi:MAG: hypothetical protein LQ346_008798 [Caloplaca aetnensis]|nr:MAG: hypothetical protein LQ346_008798 [Caloplaca aetnensis]